MEDILEIFGFGIGHFNPYLLSRKYSWCRMTSLSTSSTRIQNAWINCINNVRSVLGLLSFWFFQHFLLSILLVQYTICKTQNLHLHVVSYKVSEDGNCLLIKTYNWNKISHLGGSVNFLTPLEVRGDGQFHSQCSPCDWLDMHRQF